MLNKLRAALEKYIDFLIKKTSKIDEKSNPKVRKTLCTRKIDKKCGGLKKRVLNSKMIPKVRTPRSFGSPF